MPEKNDATQRIGGPGSSHENRKHPEKTQDRGPHPADKKSSAYSGVSGGGGEPDRRHAHVPPRPASASSPPTQPHDDEHTFAGARAKVESDHNKHNDPGQHGHGVQKHTPAEEKH